MEGIRQGVVVGICRGQLIGSLHLVTRCVGDVWILPGRGAGVQQFLHVIRIIPHPLAGEILAVNTLHVQVLDHIVGNLVNLIIISDTCCIHMAGQPFPVGQGLNLEIGSLFNRQVRRTNGVGQHLVRVLVIVRPLTPCRILQRQGNTVVSHIRPGLIAAHGVVIRLGNVGLICIAIVGDRLNAGCRHNLLDHIDRQLLTAALKVDSVCRSEVHCVLMGTHSVQHNIRGGPVEFAWNCSHI